jgi:hypothetical protein
MAVGQVRFSLWQLGRSKTSKTHHGLRWSVTRFTLSCAGLRALDETQSSEDALFFSSEFARYRPPVRTTKLFTA